ncbi:MAG: hypothetical protein ACE5KM_01845 [Planctomycetaceae bacterium]
MTTQNTTLIDAYRKQIRQCAHSLAVARNDAVLPFLSSRDVAGMVDVYTDGNLDKRIWKLTDRFEFLKDEFDELADWMQDYIRVVPLQAYDTGSSDSSIFLDWVRDNKPLTDTQQDCIACHQSRIAVEETARDNRMAHVRFQDRLTVSGSLLDELESNSELWLHLNPIRVWAAFRTTLLLDDNADLPADVLFFPVGVDVRTAVLEADGSSLIEHLGSLAPCRLNDLVNAADEWDRADVIAVVRDLVEMGLVSLG